MKPTQWGRDWNLPECQMEGISRAEFIKLPFFVSADGRISFLPKYCRPELVSMHSCRVCLYVPETETTHANEMY